jgi:ACS family tartrate transporter-like MFS transporter
MRYSKCRATWCWRGWGHAAVIYYLSLWFPGSYLARATSRLMIGIPLASAVGGPLSGLLLGLDGKLGLAGWQWLFLLQGMPAVILGFVAIRFLTDSVREARWLGEAEREWLRGRLEEEARALAGQAHRTLREVWKSPRVATLTLAYFLFAVSLYGLTLWLPIMVRDAFQVSDVGVGLIIGLLGLGGAAAMLINSRHSDRTQERVLHSAVPVVVSGIAVASAAAMGSGPGAILALMVGVMALNAMGPTFWCLPRMALQGTAAAGGIALINAVGNLGGFAGPSVLGAIRCDGSGAWRSRVRGSPTSTWRSIRWW